MTVFDPNTLHQLVDDPSGRRFTLELAATYQRMLAGRVGRVISAALGCDLDEAMDAVLSLRVSSTMTGALEMAELATAVEARLRVGDVTSARSHALLLKAAARRAEDEIGAYLASTSRCEVSV